MVPELDQFQAFDVHPHSAAQAHGSRRGDGLGVGIETTTKHPLTAVRARSRERIPPYAGSKLPGRRPGRASRLRWEARRAHGGNLVRGDTLT
jgi:hypothetical protein